MRRSKPLCFNQKGQGFHFNEMACCQQNLKLRKFLNFHISGIHDLVAVTLRLVNLS